MVEESGTLESQLEATKVSAPKGSSHPRGPWPSRHSAWSWPGPLSLDLKSLLAAVTASHLKRRRAFWYTLHPVSWHLSAADVVSPTSQASFPLLFQACAISAEFWDSIAS